MRTEITNFRGRESVFEENGSSGIFEPKKEEVTIGWGKLYREEIHDFCSPTRYYFGDEIKKVRWLGYVACIGE
jgi:hypothetical protein